MRGLVRQGAAVAVGEVDGAGLRAVLALGPGPADDGVGRNGNAVGVEVGRRHGVGETYLRHPGAEAGGAARPALDAIDGEPHPVGVDRAGPEGGETAQARGDGLAGDIVRAVGRGGGDAGGDGIRALVVVHEHGDGGDGERAGVGPLALRVVAARVAGAGGGDAVADDGGVVGAVAVMQAGRR